MGDKGMLMFFEIQQIYNTIGTKIFNESNFAEILAALMENLASIDSDTREGSLDILWELIDCGKLPADTMISMGNQLVQNLSMGIGVKDNDSVFLRTFSVLLVGALVALDERQTLQNRSYLPKDVFQDWYYKCRIYVLAEKDFRSFVPGKGWAHSISHGADVLRDFAFHRNSTAKDHKDILEILANKLLENNEEVYINNDDNRQARVVVTIMLRNELSLADYGLWLEGLRNRFDGKSLLDYAGDRQQVIPWFNTISFLRALYFILLNGMRIIQEGTIYEKEPVQRDEVMQMVLDLLKKMDRGLNYKI
jgi:hypothetical protein